MTHRTPSLLPFAGFILVLAACFIRGCCCGCTTTSKQVTTTTDITAAGGSTLTHVATADTVAAHTSATTVQRDTTVSTGWDSGTIEISRDSVGRPTLLTWHRRIHTTGMAARNVDFTMALNTSALSDSVATQNDSTTTTAAHTVEKAKTSTGLSRLERALGLTLVTLALIYIISTVWRRR